MKNRNIQVLYETPQNPGHTSTKNVYISETVSINPNQIIRDPDRGVIISANLFGLEYLHHIGAVWKIRCGRPRELLPTDLSTETFTQLINHRLLEMVKLAILV